MSGLRREERELPTPTEFCNNYYKTCHSFSSFKAEQITQSVVDKADIIIFSWLIKIRVGPFLVSKLAPTTTTLTTSREVSSMFRSPAAFAAESFFFSLISHRLNQKLKMHWSGLPMHCSCRFLFRIVNSGYRCIS